jgi:hypothetical protein
VAFSFAVALRAEIKRGFSPRAVKMTVKMRPRSL